MKNSNEDNIALLSQKKSSVRHTKSNMSKNSDADLIVENFATRILGGNNQRVLFYISLFFFLSSFLTWQIMGVSQKYSITSTTEMSSFWNWLSFTCFFFYTAFLGLGLISAFVYLTRRF